MENLPEDTDLDRRDKNPRESRPLRRSTDRIMQQASAFVASLEIIGDGVILLDSNAQISLVSKSAHAILAKMTEVIAINDNQLRFADQSSQQLLNAALEKVRLQDVAVSVNEVLVVVRPGLNRPLILSLFFLSTAAGEEPRLMLIFRDPDMEPTPQWQIFARYFSLTPQEARLSLALADGVSINEYSESFCMSPHTARTHLKSIFAKTATRRQSDLLRLIFSFTRL
jgi:DNA-binding CsgD family transcriptional regulator